MHLKAVGYTDKGKVRSENQDSFLVQVLPCSVNKHSLLAIVADGVGGASAGSIASTTAVDYIKNFNFDNVQEPQDALKQVMQSANEKIYVLSHRHKEYQGMATTCSVLLIKGDQVICGHVGDSRIYRIRAGQIDRLTEDHTLPVRLFKEGTITAEEIAGHHQSNVLTRALGSKENVEIDLSLSFLEKNDVYVLCSDGLHKYFSDNELTDILAGTAVESASEKLVSLALARGGDDNITAVVVRSSLGDVAQRTTQIADDLFPDETIKKHGFQKWVFIYGAITFFIAVFIVFLLFQMK